MTTASMCLHRLLEKDKACHRSVFLAAAVRNQRDRKNAWPSSYPAVEDYFLSSFIE